MKKIFTCGLLFAVCLGFFTSCSKDVKAPKKPASSTATTTTSTYSTPQTTNHDQQGGCGNGSYSDHNNNSGY